MGHAEAGCRGCYAKVRPGWWEGSRALPGGCRGSPLPQRPITRTLQAVKWDCGVHSLMHPWRPQNMCSGSMVHIPALTCRGQCVFYSNLRQGWAPPSPAQPPASALGAPTNVWSWKEAMDIWMASIGVSGVFLVLSGTKVCIKPYPPTCLVPSHLPDVKPRVGGIRNGPQGNE